MTRRPTALAATALVLVAQLAAVAANAETNPVSAVSANAETNPEVYAVIVGHNGGAAGLPTLRFADDDALRFAWLFSGMTPADHIWLLTEIDDDTRAELGRSKAAAPAVRPPTRTGLFNALGELREQLRRRAPGRPAVVYFLYAGHGRNSRFLLQPEAAEEAALTGRELRAAIADLPADRATLFFDACRSQSLFVERGAPTDAGPDLSAQVAELEHRAGTVRIGVLVAATSDRPAGETSGLRAGYFSHVLTSGLAGAADADANGVVSYGELAAFVAFNTVRLTGQRPWFDPPGGDLSATAVDHRGRGARLVLDHAAGGRFVIGQPDGAVMLEANQAPGKPLRLTLPPGRYQVVRVERGAGRAADVDLVAGQAMELHADALVRDAPRATDRGESDEPGFEAPFSTDVVSTLAAGYGAGREPTALRPLWRHAIRAGYTAGPSPLDLAGVEQGLTLGYRRALGRFFAGLAGDLRTGHHDLPSGGYDLRRSGLFVEGGVRFWPTRSIEVGGLAALGARGVYRISSGPTAGDGAAPASAVGGFAEMDLGAGFAATLDARYDLSWVKIDGARSVDGTPMAGLGVTWRR